MSICRDNRSLRACGYRFLGPDGEDAILWPSSDQTIIATLSQQSHRPDNRGEIRYPVGRESQMGFRDRPNALKPLESTADQRLSGANAEHRLDVHPQSFLEVPTIPFITGKGRRLPLLILNVFVNFVPFCSRMGPIPLASLLRG